MSQANQDKTAISLAELVAATAGINAMLLLELDRRGVLPKNEFAKMITTQADDLEANPPEGYDGHRRLDLAVMRAVVSFLDGPPPKNWTPTVIEGGKE